MARNTLKSEQQLNELIDKALQNGGLLKFVCNTGNAKNAYLYVELEQPGADDTDTEIFINADLSRSLLQTLAAKLYGADDSDDDDEPGEPITDAQRLQLAESRAEILQLLDYGILQTKNFGDADLIIAQGTGKVYTLTADLTGENWEIVRLRDADE